MVASIGRGCKGAATAASRGLLLSVASLASACEAGSTLELGPAAALDGGVELPADAGDARPPGPVSISLMVNHACAIDDRGSLRCWGGNSAGELGLGFAGPPVASPSEVEPSLRFVRVSAGDRSTCAIDDQGALYCWGANVDGFFLDGTTIDRSTPARVGVDADWAEIAVGTSVICGIRAGRLLCWNGASGPTEVPRGPAFTKVEVHYFGGVALDALGSAYLANWSSSPSAPSFAFNYLSALGRTRVVAMPVFGVLGVDQEGAVILVRGPQAVDVDNSAEFVAVSGAYNRCAITKREGELRCQMANRPPDPVLALERADFGSDWADIRVGVGMTCGSKRDGSVWCLDVSDDGTFGPGPPIQVVAAN